MDDLHPDAPAPHSCAPMPPGVPSRLPPPANVWGVAGITALSREVADNTLQHRGRKASPSETKSSSSSLVVWRVGQRVKQALQVRSSGTTNVRPLAPLTVDTRRRPALRPCACKFSVHRRRASGSPGPKAPRTILVRGSSCGGCMQGMGFWLFEVLLPFASLHTANP